MNYKDLRIYFKLPTTQQNKSFTMISKIKTHQEDSFEHLKKHHRLSHQLKNL